MLWATATWAQTPAAGDPAPLVLDSTPLSLMQRVESVYAPTAMPTEDEGLNAGGVHMDLTVSYFTDYVFRGVERFDHAIPTEDAPNLEVEAMLSFDLGKLPHPFIGVFANVADTDTVSNFEEIRPYIGAAWTIRPITLTAGHNTYLFPNRSEIESSEFFVKLALDDSYFLRSDEPFLAPYVYGAYDYDRYNGWYFEAGVEHRFKIEDTGIVLTAQASVAYVKGIELFVGPRGQESGFQHYQIGLVGTYSLNKLLNFSKRYGEWSLKGYLYYTDGIGDKLKADTQLWGGGGIEFSY